MVTERSIQKQLKHIGFKTYGWGRAEVRELPHIILPDEKIFECVNGIYEGGFALLVATDVRVLLIDKKPLNFLTVEDQRFDQINQIDYNHRALGAFITISTGIKTLKFRSYNQPRLRKLIGHVQHCMAEGKKTQTDHQEGQNQRLEQINQQLQAYLMAQHRHQEMLQQHLQQLQQGTTAALPQPDPVRPSPELSDYLLAQSLLDQYQQQTAQTDSQSVLTPQLPLPDTAESPRVDLYAEGMKEIFGKRQPQVPPVDPQAHLYRSQDPSDINPLLRIAYSKLPTALRNRKFGRRPKSKLRAPGEAEAI